MCIHLPTLDSSRCSFQCPPVEQPPSVCAGLLMMGTTSSWLPQACYALSTQSDDCSTPLTLPCAACVSSWLLLLLVTRQALLCAPWESSLICCRLGSVVYVAVCGLLSSPSLRTSPCLAQRFAAWSRCTRFMVPLFLCENSWISSTSSRYLRIK